MQGGDDQRQGRYESLQPLLPRPGGDVEVNAPSASHAPNGGTGFQSGTRNGVAPIHCPARQVPLLRTRRSASLPVESATLPRDLVGGELPGSCRQSGTAPDSGPGGHRDCRGRRLCPCRRRSRPQKEHTGRARQARAVNLFWQQEKSPVFPSLFPHLLPMKKSPAAASRAGAAHRGEGGRGGPPAGGQKY